MQIHEAKNENLELKVENQQELLVKLRDRNEDLGNCQICDDRASGFHYGLATCDGCRGFFLRKVVTESYRKLKCSLNQNCSTYKFTRNRCQYCRFQKCLAKGMKIEAIPVEVRNKWAIYYNLNTSDRDDGHGKVKGDAEMENAEDDYDDFVLVDFSAMDIREEESTKNAQQSLVTNSKITALEAKVETLEAKNEMWKSKLENQELKAKMQNDSLKRKLEEYEQKMAKLTKEMANLSVENQKLKQTDFEALEKEMLKTVQIRNKEQPGNMDELKTEWAKMFAELYNLYDDPVRKEWLDDWLQFMHQIGKPVTRLPIMAKQILDLFEFYQLVVQHGGLVEVIKKKLWRQIIKGLGLPCITCSVFPLRKQYAKYLYDYECHRHNFSRMADLRAAVEGNEREERKPLVTYLNCVPTSN